MASAKLKAFLDNRGVKYVSIQHSPAFTAAEVAMAAHVARRDFAKTLILFVNSTMTMVVLPASRRLLLHDLREMLGTHDVRLASEMEFQDAFPDCELGAMPPFGNLYGMKVYVAAALAEEPEIVFNAGTHTEVIKMSYEDFSDLVKPEVLELVTT